MEASKESSPLPLFQQAFGFTGLDKSKGESVHISKEGRVSKFSVNRFRGVGLLEDQIRTNQRVLLQVSNLLKGEKTKDEDKTINKLAKKIVNLTIKEGFVEKKDYKQLSSEILEFLHNQEGISLPVFHKFFGLSELVLNENEFISISEKGKTSIESVKGGDLDSIFEEMKHSTLVLLQVRNLLAGHKASDSDEEINKLAKKIFKNAKKSLSSSEKEQLVNEIKAFIDRQINPILNSKRATIREKKAGDLLESLTSFQATSQAVEADIRQSITSDREEDLPTHIGGDIKRYLESHTLKFQDEEGHDLLSIYGDQYEIDTGNLTKEALKNEALKHQFIGILNIILNHLESSDRHDASANRLSEESQAIIDEFRAFVEPEEMTEKGLPAKQVLVPEKISAFFLLLRKGYSPRVDEKGQPVPFDPPLDKRAIQVAKALQGLDQRIHMRLAKSLLFTSKLMSPVKGSALKEDDIKFASRSADESIIFQINQEGNLKFNHVIYLINKDHPTDRRGEGGEDLRYPTECQYELKADFTIESPITDLDNWTITLNDIGVGRLPFEEEDLNVAAFLRQFQHTLHVAGFKTYEYERSKAVLR